MSLKLPQSIVATAEVSDAQDVLQIPARHDDAFFPHGKRPSTVTA
jgi:hypothetical protein